MPEPADIPLDIEGSLAMQGVELVVLVGLPGESSPASHGAVASCRLLA